MLKKNHNFYYQIQGQLNICGISWCDLLVRSSVPGDIFVQRITQDNNFWKTSMLPKLQDFYFNALRAELASPRYKTTGCIRDNLSLVCIFLGVDFSRSTNPLCFFLIIHILRAYNCFWNCLGIFQSGCFQQCCCGYCGVWRRLIEGKLVLRS